jgi:sulfate adenylyltransferase
MSEQTQIQPHGGSLIQRVAAPEARAEAAARAAHSPALDLTPRNASDLLLLATGAFSPLEGFLGYDAARSVVQSLRLPEGALWPLPVLLATTRSQAEGFSPGDLAALRFNGALLGTLRVEERFAVPAREWAKEIFQTDAEKHPGVRAFLEAGETALAGKVEWFGDPAALGLDVHWQSPAHVRAEIARRGWQSVAGFQTRNPIHRAHEYVLRVALEVSDGLLLHPLVGETRPEDLPAPLRLRCYQVLLERYLPQARVLFSVLPAWMRFGGPREAVFHALIRKNFGCTHFLVGRDHAGVGGYYGPYEAHRLLRSLERAGLDIQPIFFQEVFYCRSCGSMASARTCAHPPEAHLSLSGSEVRRHLREKMPLPEEFTRPEVAALLAGAFQETGEVTHA